MSITLVVCTWNKSIRCSPAKVLVEQKIESERGKTGRKWKRAKSRGGYFSCRSSSWIDDGIFSGGGKTYTALSPKGYTRPASTLWEHVNRIDGRGRARLIYLQPFNLTIQGTWGKPASEPEKKEKLGQTFFFIHPADGSEEKRPRDPFGTKLWTPE